MIQTQNPIIKHQARLLNLAEALGHVSKACNIMGVSQDTFYRYKALVKDGRIGKLIHNSRRSPHPKHRVDESTARAVVADAVDPPAHGQHRASHALRKSGVFISDSGIRSIWVRHQLENFKKHLKA
jgi:hypothetical protein